MSTGRGDKLSPKEFELFELWLRGKKPLWGAFQIPANKPGIRDNPDYQRWLREAAPARVTEATRRVFEEKLGEELPSGVTVAPESPAERTARMQREQAEAAGVYGEEETGFPKMATKWEIISEGGWDIKVGYDSEGNIVSHEPIGRTEEAEEGMTEAQRAQLEWEKEKYGAPSEQDVWEREWLQKQAQMEQAWAEKEATREQSQFEQQMQWYEQQAQMEQQMYREQEMARLAAQPISWLQYAAYTGQQPVVQPWMQPLMPQEYGREAGQPIPGWTAQSAQGMPELTRPSAQLWSRMTPSAQQQYQGYKQARTGATPSDVDWRRRSTAPPGGGNRAVSWLR